ncbi:MAG TPA: chemotaxis protein CheA [Polyangiaceae bacterium]
MSDLDLEILNEFLLETHENLDLLDRELVALERAPAQRDRLSAIFRVLHTLKGTASFLGFTSLTTIAHAGESVLGRLREPTVPITGEVTSALLAMIDTVRAILAKVEHTHAEGEADHGALLERLARAGVPSEEPAAPLAAPTLRPALPPAAARALTEFPVEEDVPAHESSVSETIRVDVEVLDELMNLVGELVLARNQLLKRRPSEADPELTIASQRVNAITTSLQEVVMKTRMQPIGTIWNKLPRMVRDLARACGKDVTIDLHGAGTDIDRTIIDAIRDPLLHVVRNAIDHGIEKPAARVEAGKSPIGKLSLRAFHEGGLVVVEIRDDGGGIDLTRVRRKATERNLIPADRVPTERELFGLLFAPGFSTADRITDVSGRGVGMDVVKSSVERIGGSVDLQSVKGFGTLVRLKIPLTLAIIPALMVRANGDQFAVPQLNLLEVVRLEGTDARSRVEHVNGAPVHRLRENLLPLVFLSDLFKLPPPASPPPALHIVVVEAENRQLGLVVDDISETEEIVVKPLGKELRDLEVFAGATILGDGAIALILDIAGVASRARLSGEKTRKSAALATITPAGPAKQPLLVFEKANTERAAIALPFVARIEEIPRARCEQVGGKTVVLHRGDVLPIVDTLVPSTNPTMQVIVCQAEGKHVGLVIERIVDIVEEVVELRNANPSRCVLGVTTVAGRATEIVDPHALIDRAGIVPLATATPQAGGMRIAS